MRRHRHHVLFGNLFMGAGLISIFGGILLSILSYAPKMNIPDVYGNVAIGVVFVGAIIWLIGAKFRGIEQIDERYWQIRYATRRHHRQ